MEENQIELEEVTIESEEEYQDEKDENIGYKLRNLVLIFLITSSIILSAAFMLFIPVSVYKPAIYLYPEKTTEIRVKLDESIKYINVIPKYTKTGWFVEAEPNGVLKDLQPKYTKCEKLPYKEFGFEYSKKACEINKYPYIYWDGIQTKKPLPDKKEGFIVDSENIEQFLSSKADEIGFNSEEKKEFVRYWTKKTKETKWGKYKIYFLQDEAVDDYLPIYVEPKPINSNRIEIIVKKAKKNEKIEEQKLIPFKRDGYTLVEWGGMIVR